jgi:hypothetical protein
MEQRRFRNAGPVSLLLMVLAGFLCPLTGFADPYETGGYTIEVDVRTSWWFPIANPWVKCSKWGNQITVSAHVPGYVPQERKLSIKPNVQKYDVTILMPDKPKRLDVMTYNYKPIASAYFDRYQGGTPPNKYSVNLFLPVKSWPNPSPDKVKLNQPGYGWPIQETCDISVRDEFYLVRMLIDRAVLDDPNDELLVYVNTGETLSPEATGKWFADLRRLEQGNPVRAEEIARALFFHLPPHLLISLNPPASIACLAALRIKFDRLHELPQRHSTPR